jgi:biotin transport system ATP-binding protein
MDEPFANLDYPGVRDLCGVINSLRAGGKTLIVVTHELEKALAFATRLIILHRGSIAADGAPEDVLDMLRPEWGVRDPRRSCRSVADCDWLAPDPRDAS